MTARPWRGRLAGPAETAAKAATPVGNATRQRFAWVALPCLLVLVALGLSVPRLTAIDEYVFDELYYAYTAGQYVAGNEAYDVRIPPENDPAIEWTHPPLAKLLIAGGILVAGDNPVGWRLVSVFFGAVGMVVVYALALTLTGQRWISALAAGLLLMDGLYLTESRLGMSNLIVLVLTSATILAFAHFLAAPPTGLAPPLLATGLLLGLALATKWSAVALGGLIGLIAIWRLVRLWRAASVRGDLAARREVRRAALLWLPVSLVAVPLAVYLLSYTHFFLTGHSWRDLITLHQDMFRYHRELGVVHSDSSAWWEWPLVLQPVWYYIDEGRRRGHYILANGNLLLYWPMVVAVGWVAIEWWGRRAAAVTVLLLGFFGQWLPWALSPRGTFVYHFMPAVPFGCIAIAVLIAGAWRRGGLWRVAAVAYTGAVVATFAFFYPVLTGQLISVEQLDARLWLGSWR